MANYPSFKPTRPPEKKKVAKKKAPKPKPSPVPILPGQLGTWEVQDAKKKADRKKKMSGKIKR